MINSGHFGGGEGEGRELLVLCFGVFLLLFNT
jgi:hypothetical protein